MYAAAGAGAEWGALIVVVAVCGDFVARCVLVAGAWGIRHRRKSCFGCVQSNIAAGYQREAEYVGGEKWEEETMHEV